jgi:enamine deaminase RidA (YjgF/YER057c/UK114 family)
MTSSAITRHESTGKLSRVVVHQGTAYLSGITAADRSVDTKGQTRQILERAGTLLAAAGTTKSRLLYVQIWLRDIGDFDAMNEAWLGWVDPDALPARATVEAKFALPDIRVEIQMVAAV